jgi:hypothetical protein
MKNCLLIGWLSLVVGVLAGCSTTQWVPPQSAQGQACIKACGEVRDACNNMRSISTASCVDNANDYLSSYDAVDAYRQPTCGAESAQAQVRQQCAQSYRSCYVQCGGQVVQ